MAGHILAAGYPVTVFNRSRSKTEALAAKGGEDSSYINRLFPFRGLHPSGFHSPSCRLA